MYKLNTTLQKIMKDVMFFNDVVVPDNMQPCLVYIQRALVGRDLDYHLSGFFFP